MTSTWKLFSFFFWYAFFISFWGERDEKKKIKASGDTWQYGRQVAPKFRRRLPTQPTETRTAQHNVRFPFNSKSPPCIPHTSPMDNNNNNNNIWYCFGKGLGHQLIALLYLSGFIQSLTKITVVPAKHHKAVVH